MTLVRNTKFRFGLGAIFASVVLLARIVVADGEGDQSNVQVDIIARGGANPSAIAYRPGGTEVAYEVFVADAASGAVIRFSSREPGVTQEAISGFDSHQSGQRQQNGIGMLFLSNTRLLVSGGNPAGDPQTVRVYELPDDGSTVNADNPRQKCVFDEDLALAGDALEFGAIAANENTIFVAAWDPTGQAGILLKSRRRGRMIDDLDLFAKFQPIRRELGVAALAVNPHPGKPYLVAGLPAADDASTSRLVFYHPLTGQELLILATGLDRLTGLAYSPRSGLLYASGSNSEFSGIFRLDAATENGKPSCRPTVITNLNNPTTLSFAPDGTLLVAAHDESAQAVIVQITGNL